MLESIVLAAALALLTPASPSPAASALPSPAPTANDIIYNQVGIPLTQPIHYGTGMPAAAKVGIAAFRIEELFDDPAELQKPASQDFGIAWIAQVDNLAPSPNDDLFTNFGVTFMSEFASGGQLTISANPGPTADFKTQFLSLVGHMSDDNRSAVMYGLLLQILQAAIARGQSIDSPMYKPALEALIGKNPPDAAFARFDAQVSGLKDLQAQLAATRTDPVAVAKIVQQMMDKILASG